MASPYAVTITAADSDGNTASQRFSWTIAPLVALTRPSYQTSAEGESISLSVSASDAHSGTLTFSATGLPSGLAINSSTGVISGTLASGSAGAYTGTASASNGTDARYQLFTWAVAPHLNVTAPANQAKPPWGPGLC